MVSTKPILPPTPCNTCPYRLSTPFGIWHESEYRKLPLYDAGGTELSIFHCHQENATGVPTLCRGWVSCHRFDSIAVRFAVIRGVLTIDQVEEECPVPLYATGREACEAGLAGVEEPSSKAQRVMERLVRKGIGKASIDVE